MGMTTDNWITVVGIIAQLCIAIVSFFITKHQLKLGAKENRLSLIRGLLDEFRALSCEYWGKTSFPSEHQLMLENNIKSCKKDIATNLNYLHNKFSSIRKKIYDFRNQFNDIYELTTGKNFETSSRRQDINKCNKIIDDIANLKEKLDTI